VQDALARELEAFQHDIVQLSQEQAARAARDDTLRADFAAITARCDTLIGQWSAVAAHDAAEATNDTSAQRRRELARELHAHCTEMIQAIEVRRAMEAQGHALYVEWFTVERRVRRLRQSLDRELFGGMHPRTERSDDEHTDDIDAKTLLLHEMRTHLTMALLAADRLNRSPHSVRSARFIDYLMTGLALLQRDLDILDPSLVVEP
jgi:hypothetical protein